MSRRGRADPLVRVVVRRIDPNAPEPIQFEALLRLYANGEQELVAAGGDSLPDLQRDEQLTISRPVAGDARYAQPVHVLGAAEAAGAISLAADGERTRNQQREHVRVDTTPFPVVLLLPEPEPDPDADEDPAAAAAPARPVRSAGAASVESDGSSDDEDEEDESYVRSGSLKDISGGGARVVFDGKPLEPGALVRFQCELPADGGPPIKLDTEAQVRWAGPGPYEKQMVGLRFTEATRGMERTLTSWVFRYQAKTLRDAKR